MPGSHPDPSVTKVGNTFWASATSSNWFPAFPLFSSKDLINWKEEGYVFNELPAWIEKYTWAPEVSYDSGRVYVYYTAKKKGGPLCVGIASAASPEGPYIDHGPIVCQEYGSIDGFPIRDTAGVLYLVWKEDANSVNKPTIIWAQQMNEERTQLLGERYELFRNDQPWEHDLVEGVSMMRHGEYYYAFYAAAGCCGDRCTYVTGIARATNLLGPWEKYERNPILTDDKNWLCKGHGTPVEMNGRHYFLYHGYHSQSSAYTGREGLLQEFRFTEDDWVEFINPVTDSVIRRDVITDEFNEEALPHKWQTSVFHKAKYQLQDGAVRLFGMPIPSGAFLAQKIPSANYTATTVVAATRSTAYGGIAAIGDEDNMLALLVKDFQLQILKVQNGKDSIRELFRIPVVEKVYLQISIEGPYRTTFLYSIDGKKFIRINNTPLRGAYLPPWDSPPFVGIVAKGNTDEFAFFDRFEIRLGALKSSIVSEEPRTGRLWLYITTGLVALLVIAGAVKLYRDKHKKSVVEKAPLKVDDAG
ncbi:family 43 glycosylhydrolase [Aridibaculum aurantiacum]|uniref:family 43 glycosylhydrolase n=1 Tax=Aridibaculum aurantiacum TaxID=2810307 RepID=UPI001A95942D|nr:family 43 glycosylhydrolase [Aridibaculum aurantiacum]